jgi:hypothetical protein
MVRQQTSGNNGRGIITMADRLQEKAPSGSVVGVDRRQALRFPIHMQVRYRVIKDPLVFGAGYSINISSAGILLSVDRPLSPHQALEVALDWPVYLNQTIPLQLVIEGAVVRSEPGCAVVSIDRFEFRTARSRE